MITEAKCELKCSLFQKSIQLRTLVQYGAMNTSAICILHYVLMEKIYSDTVYNIECDVYMRYE